MKAQRKILLLHFCSNSSLLSVDNSGTAILGGYRSGRLILAYSVLVDERLWSLRVALAKGEDQWPVACPRVVISSQLGIQRKDGPGATKDGYHGHKQTLPRYEQPALFDFSKNRKSFCPSSKLW
jgi:hypothetical protein